MLDATSDRPTPRDLTPGLPKDEFIDFIFWVHGMGASDLRLQSNDYVWADLNRMWLPVSARRLENQEVERALTILTDASSVGLLSSGKPVDARVDLPRSAREIIEFRLNATAATVAGVREGIAITMRAIPHSIPSLGQLGIEQEIIDNLFPRNGMLLTVGTTGSGKSTFQVAALRERLVERRHDPVSIGTYEDPIEYGLSGLAEGHMPEPSQMAVGRGRHVESFQMVGPNAMRRRFDVIVAGEIRDIESAQMGCELARTGHCVMATLHVDTPGEAFDRLIKFYPHEQQASEAYSLLSQVRLIVAQKLCRTIQGGKMAFRSWIVVDRQVKDELYKIEPGMWAMRVKEIVRERGNDFESAAYRAYAQGRITEESFREIAGLTLREAREYIENEQAKAAAQGSGVEAGS